MAGEQTRDIDETKFGALLDICSEAIFTVDAGDRIQDWSRSAERIFGHAASDVTGQPTRMVLAGDGSADAIAALRAARGGHGLRHLEVDLQRRDGMTLPVSLSVALITEANGAAGVLVVVARDLTERQAAQAALARAESRVWHTEAPEHEGAWLWDVRTGTVQWTEELHRIADLDPVDFEGTIDAYLMVVHDDDREELRHAMDTAVAKGELFVLRCRIVRPDGSERSVDVRGVPAAASAGMVVGLRGTVRDVTGEYG